MVKAMQPAVRVHLADLKEKAEKLPRKANEDAGLMARGILGKSGRDGYKRFAWSGNIRKGYN